MQKSGLATPELFSRGVSVSCLLLTELCAKGTGAVKWQTKGAKPVRAPPAGIRRLAHGLL